MPRPKGSKNAVRTKKANIDYAAVVAEKTTAKEQIETEITALSDNISTLKEQLKSKKSACSPLIYGEWVETCQPYLDLYTSLLGT